MHQLQRLSLLWPCLEMMQLRCLHSVAFVLSHLQMGPFLTDQRFSDIRKALSALNIDCGRIKDMIFWGRSMLEVHVVSAYADQMSRLLAAAGLTVTAFANLDQISPTSVYFIITKK